MIGRLLAGAAVLAVAGGAAFWLVTMPDRLEAADLPNHPGDVDAGRLMFDVGGCASCHAAEGAKGDDRLNLGGGRELSTDFGVFRVPNISPDPRTGIGGWSTLDFVNAMTRGVTPDGAHYYPSFPYTSYARMRVEDAIDLKAFIDTLPPVSNDVAAHSMRFPFGLRRGIGLWKRLNLDPAPVVALDGDAPADLLRGRYLVEGPGHCGECHTRRDAFGGLDTGAWLAGAPNPEGRGVIPNITTGPGGIGDWSHDDLVTSFETGFMPDFDTYSGQMAEVQENLARISAEDRAAIAAYLKAAPPLPDAVPPAN